MTAAGSAAPWLTIVGLGEDGIDGLSPRAVQALAEAGLVVGGTRHLALAASVVTGETLAWRSPIEETFPALLARRGKPTCVLATGDPFHFGVGATLARHVADGEILCLPQPSAFSLAAARLGWAIQDCVCLSLHGRALERIVPHLQPGRRLLALSWDGGTPTRVAALLDARGFGPSAVIVCERMGGPAERVRHGTAEGFAIAGAADLNTIAVEVRAARGARIRPFTPGLPDSWFENDGQITKAPIRAVTLSALAPRAGDCLWDVGAGSGSVSIEWLLAHESTRAVAVDRRPDRLARAGRNAAAWGVAERMTPVEGEAPAALRDLPTPDAIFLGGGVSGLGLLDVCRDALAPCGRLVANAVTLESQQLLSEARLRHGGELITLAFATAEPVGGFHGFRPAMPMTQWRWIRP